MKRYLTYLIVIFLFTSSNLLSQKLDLELGADRIVSDQLDLVINNNLGVVTNHSALLSNGIHLVDSLNNIKSCNIVALFGPEHGIRGNAPAGEKIKDGIDAKTNIPVYSLYGETHKPSIEMLKNVDILIFDIQDIGARFYTFISTLYYILIAAAENDIPIIILDRPNPINGITIDGPIRKDEFKSFVAIAPIPIQHGMTIGELALMFNNEKWLGIENAAELTVVKMKGWKRDSYFDDFNIRWVNPSPNIPSLDAAILYPGMCLLEGVNISEGRGTYSPFSIFGAPFIDSKSLLNLLNSLDHSGLKLEETKFTPISIENMSTYPKYKEKECFGISINVDDRSKIKSLRFGIQVLHAIKTLFPEDFEYRKNWLDKLFGDTYLRKMLEEGKSPEEIFAAWEPDLEKFKVLRNNYLLY